MVNYEQLNRSVQGVLATPLDAANTRLRSARMASVSQPPLFTFDKVCPVCHKSRAFSDYSPQLTGVGKLAYSCRFCRSTAEKQKYAASAEYRDQKRFIHKLRTYGITREQYEAMLAGQSGVCAICGELPSTGMGKAFHVDHDHATGVIRGLLCHECNTGLGKFKDDARMVEMAAAYLRKHE